jgi:hypothetical protein
MLFLCFILGLAGFCDFLGNKQGKGRSVIQGGTDTQNLLSAKALMRFIPSGVQ